MVLRSEHRVIRHLRVHFCLLQRVRGTGGPVTKGVQLAVHGFFSFNYLKKCFCIFAAGQRREFGF